MTTPEGSGTAAAGEGGGAAQGQTSEAEVTELRTQLATAEAKVSEQVTALEITSVAVTELQTANKKFADDAVGLAGQAQQLKDAQQQLEESRKTSTDLTALLEQAKTSNGTLLDQMIARRRQDLVAKFGLPEERVAELDDAGLTVLESTLPHVPAATTTPTAVLTANGLGIKPAGGEVNLSEMSDSERAVRIVERLKASKG